MKQPKIAVYSIALNEIKHVDRYAEATKHADYRIVADTGSTDGTQEALKKHGITVHDIRVMPWRFDVARNVALSLVPTDADICLILDLDEVPEPKFFSKIRNKWVEGSDFGWITMDTGNRWERDRLHSRSGWVWKYACHEVQKWYGPGEPKGCLILDATIYHKPDDSKSRGQYLTLLEMSVREEPLDPRQWTYMTREYYFHQRWDDVIRAGERMLECPGGWDVEQAAVCRWVAEAYHWKEDKENCTKWYEKGAEILPSQGEPWYGVAVDAYRNNRWQACLTAAINAFEKPRSNHYCHEAAIWDWKAYDLAGISAYNLGMYQEAVAFVTEAVKGGGPEADRIQRNLEFMKAKLNG